METPAHLELVFKDGAYATEKGDEVRISLHPSRCQVCDFFTVVMLDLRTEVTLCGMSICLRCKLLRRPKEAKNIPVGVQISNKNCRLCYIRASCTCPAGHCWAHDAYAAHERGEPALHAHAWLLTLQKGAG